jgi:hypothetical protein
MSDTPGPANLSKEERLAARLRENLRRRKAQARALASDSSPDGQPLSKEDEAR